MGTTFTTKLSPAAQFVLNKFCADRKDEEVRQDFKYLAAALRAVSDAKGYFYDPVWVLADDDIHAIADELEAQ